MSKKFYRASTYRQSQMFFLLFQATVFLAEDIMKYNPITIVKNAYLGQAAQIMTGNRISGLPVIQCSSDDDNLVGIITKTDIIEALMFTIN